MGLHTLRGPFFLWCYASEHFNNGGAQNRSLPVPTPESHCFIFPTVSQKEGCSWLKRNEDFPASVHISKNFYVLTQQSLKQNQDLHMITQKTALKYMIARRKVNFLLFFWVFTNCANYTESDCGCFGVVNCDISDLGLNKNYQLFFYLVTVNCLILSPLHLTPPPAFSCIKFLFLCLLSPGQWLHTDAQHTLYTSQTKKLTAAGGRHLNLWPFVQFTVLHPADGWVTVVL